MPGFFVSRIMSIDSYPLISRKEAKEKGLKRYNNGIPCPKNHNSERAVVSGTCIECTKEASAANMRRRRQDPEYRAEQSKKSAVYNLNRRKTDPEWRAKQVAIISSYKKRRNKIDPEWRKKNNAQVARRKRERKKNDIHFKIEAALRCRLYNAIKGNAKIGSAVQDLGCTIAEFKSYIEEQFEPWMTWENWAHDTWHLDHIRPLASFDLSDREQFLMAAHWSNFRPLSAFENMSKGAKEDRSKSIKLKAKEINNDGRQLRAA